MILETERLMMKMEFTVGSIGALTVIGSMDSDFGR